MNRVRDARISRRDIKGQTLGVLKRLPIFLRGPQQYVALNGGMTYFTIRKQDGLKHDHPSARGLEPHCCALVDRRKGGQLCKMLGAVASSSVGEPTPRSDPWSRPRP